MSGQVAVLLRKWRFHVSMSQCCCLCCCTICAHLLSQLNLYISQLNQYVSCIIRAQVNFRRCVEKHGRAWTSRRLVLSAKSMSTCCSSLSARRVSSDFRVTPGTYALVRSPIASGSLPVLASRVCRATLAVMFACCCTRGMWEGLQTLPNASSPRISGGELAGGAGGSP
jgi:hypothetical protein